MIINELLKKELPQIPLEIADSLIKNEITKTPFNKLNDIYPSTTTMLVMCIMPTTIMQFNNRIKNETLKKLISLSIIVFILFMVIGRIFSGVHWITDIIGGAILSYGLVMLYCFVSKLKFSNR